MNIQKFIFILTIISISFLNINVNSGYILPIVSGDNVNVRDEPNANSIILTKLRIGQEVKLIKRSGKKEKINGNEGEWIYIDSNRIDLNKNVTIKGWVFDYYLVSDFSKFKRITKLKFDKCIFEFEIGDSYFNFEIFQNGTYTLTNKDLFLDKEGEKAQGTIYKYNNLILFKNSKGEIDMIFYVNEEEYLCHTEFDLKGRSDCSKCKWE